MTMLSHGRKAIALTTAALTLGCAGAASAAVRVPLSGWNWGNPTPQGNDLKAIDFLGGRGYAVGNAGTALRTDDGGETWSGLATGTQGNLTKLQIVDPETLVVLGADGCVLRRSANGGATFSRIFVVAEANCPDRVRAFHFIDKNTGYLLLADGSVLRTTDAGQSFSKQTAIPGTPAGATAGSAAPADILFSAPDSGIAFVTPGPGPSLAYTTTDGGVSWKPLLTIDPGVVTQLYRVDADTIYAIGPGTLLRSTDAGATFVKRPFGTGLRLTSIRCADALTCLITTDKGELNRTTDGGATATPITASSVPLASAAFATATRAVAVGSAGKTVVSDDGGVNYVSIGGDVGGAFFRLRRGPIPTSAFAPGAKGQLAFTADAGETWKVASVSTSSDLADTSWPDLKTGYAIDVKGGLFRTANGGVSWSTLSPGAGSPARAVLALPGGDVVLLVGDKGIRRATGGGEFNRVGGELIGRTSFDDAQLAGSAIFAWARDGGRLFVSTDKGVHWKAVRRPTKTTRVRSVSFLGRLAGYLLDTKGRVWSTRNGGSSWKESIATGTSRATSLSFGTAAGGYLNVGDFGSGQGYVLRTTDGGATWRPQSIATSSLLPDGLVAGDGAHAFGLVGAGAVQRQFFFTASGGDAGSASSLTLKATPKRFTKNTLKRARGRLTISGKLAGAVGGERVVVSVRPASGSSWTSRSVTAGANGGSFSATFTIKRSEVVVAQWAGDSGRAGVGSKPLLVSVR
ncbi:MAG: hypothetical protein QOE31_2356 [Solirubrobacteraceae bacterium]|nr:hypothetical protein [Solirubrobacteraceae bacterium]